MWGPAPTPPGYFWKEEAGGSATDSLCCGVFGARGREEALTAGEAGAGFALKCDRAGARAIVQAGEQGRFAQRERAAAGGEGTAQGEGIGRRLRGAWGNLSAQPRRAREGSCAQLAGDPGVHRPRALELGFCFGERGRTGRAG